MRTSDFLQQKHRWRRCNWRIGISKLTPQEIPMKNITLVAVILCAIVASLFLFRYEIVTAGGFESPIAACKIDRWTGTVWVIHYNSFMGRAEERQATRQLTP